MHFDQLCSISDTLQNSHPEVAYMAVVANGKNPGNTERLLQTTVVFAQEHPDGHGTGLKTQNERRANSHLRD